MYLKEILLENIASIKSLDLTLPFNSDNTPKPVVFVGINGSGKSIVLSYIMDALYEYIRETFKSIFDKTNDLSTPYLKIHNNLSIKIGESYSLGLLEFTQNFNSSKGYNYLEKAGSLNAEVYRSKLSDRFTDMEGVLSDNYHNWLTEGYMKRVSPKPIDIENFKKIFSSNVFCYFPSNRYEIPHWLNPEILNKKTENKNNIDYSDFLNNPIYVDSSLETNKTWILDVSLDSLLENETGIDNLKQEKVNLDKIIQEILQNTNAKLKINNRNHDSSRLCISIDNKIIIPSLDNLSTGQTLLFNLFLTIIRYADNLDYTKSFRLEDITGMVLIDEIDAHLHSDLQYKVLPKLLKLFPKIQFIVTTHSPLFILGMEKEYGSDGFQIIELPEGSRITTERFSEFQKSFDYYQETKAFFEKVERDIVNQTIPMMYVEGKTDEIYIKTAFALLGREDLLQKITIKQIGFTDDEGQTKFGGSNHLNLVFKEIKCKPELSNRKILFLYDCDTNKPPENYESLRVRCIPKNPENTKHQKGIENLIPVDYISEPSFDENRFYIQKNKGKNGEISDKDFQKKEFCTWVCEEIKDKKYFEKFNVIIEIVDEFLENT